MERLTQKLYDATLAKEQTQDRAWYALACKGYYPGEIAVWAPSGVAFNDIGYRVRTYAERHDLPIPASVARQRIRTKRPIPTDWKAAFRAKVMRVGLSLSLSQPMLEMLCAVSDDVHWDRLYMHDMGLQDTWLTTGPALAKRGLIQPTTHLVKRELNWELTPAGAAVVELLRVVGVFVAADKALEKKQA